MMRIRPVRSRWAFTLIELLVVIAIIAMLTGVLVPSIKMVSRSAKRLKQSSVFHGYSTGLELFNKDFDGYPDSDVLSGAGGSVCGAQHLAEAMMGIDQKGFDPRSRWYAPSHGTDVYASAARGSTAAEITASNNRRKEVYIEQKDDGCYALADVYDVANGGSIGPVYSPSGFAQARAPVLTDIFKKKRITLTTATGGTNRVKVGTPVLYFKADTTSRLFTDDPLGIGNHANWIYNYDDNQAIIDLGTVPDQTVRHDFEAGRQTTRNVPAMDGLNWFYETIKDSRVDAYDKPHNAKTFILMSAGPDGVFGTKDDVTNFN
ncbi:MAG: hypothetical protein DRP66_01955 [Planctomycetota bacterium]|nr:MAG: hypothetical protein DRP66_01955 [Planctomycetota bacterium]